MTVPNEERMVFAVTTAAADGDPPTVLIGIPAQAYAYIQNGLTNTFDLTLAGVPIKLVLFGAPTYAEAERTVLKACAQAGVTIVDDRDRDFAIKP